MSYHHTFRRDYEEAKIDKMFAKFDVDGDGQLDVKEQQAMEDELRDEKVIWKC